ncbi:MAG: hypothetical protein PHV93_03175 [Candidatus Pacebacteria bacterium]|nr:hypothetical protein [Candidatus Paceibacterota bacterium]
MNTILQTNIFFIITSVAVVVVLLFLIVILSFTILILKDLKHLTKKGKEEGEKILDDIGGMRSEIKAKKTAIALFLFFLGQRIKKFFHRRPREEEYY